MLVFVNAKPQLSYIFAILYSLIMYQLDSVTTASLNYLLHSTP
jgi:hypothetical protein